MAWAKDVRLLSDQRAIHTAALVQATDPCPIPTPSYMVGIVIKSTTIIEK